MTWNGTAKRGEPRHRGIEEQCWTNGHLCRIPYLTRWQVFLGAHGAAGVFKSHAPWGVHVPEGHAAFYAVRQGEVWLTLPDLEEPVQLRAGDVVLIPRGSGHRLQDRPSGQEFDDFNQFTGVVGTPAVNGNGHADVTHLIFGYSLSQGSSLNPLHANLSSLIHMNQDQYEQLQQLDGLFSMLEDEQRRRQPGWQAIAKHLLQLMFYQSLRAFITCADREPGTENGSSQSVVSDAAIGLVVGLLHSQPGDPWTVASLARWVNMSRSAFSERFREVVGQPPLHYLTELRMARACQMLASTDLGVKQIATMVGYESPSSFTNAFKRWNGVSPATYREHSSDKSMAIHGA